MKKLKILLPISIYLALGLANNAFAHSGHEHSKNNIHTWKNVIKNKEIKGSFLSYINNKVYFEDLNGNVSFIPIEELSKEDYNLVKNKLAQIKKINEVKSSYELSNRDNDYNSKVLALDNKNKSLILNPFILSLITGSILSIFLLIIYYKKTNYRSFLVLLVTPSTIFVACNNTQGNINQQNIEKKDLNQNLSSNKPSTSSTPINNLQNNISTTDNLSLLASSFEPFKDSVKTRQDNKYFYVESNGIPNHQLMVGITSWQQQVPLPQDYYGENAWSIPLHPVLSENPISTKNNFYKGAIAVAVNGIPIFNALNNRGDDALLAGELDKWGGHCGRADDYHYHIAPTHLENIVGKNKPLAYALDGFPIYGSLEPDNTEMKKLDENNGHFDSNNSYHYHATSTYPYTVGKMRGVVQSDGEQIIPQPRTIPVRQFLQPLKGAVITDFKNTGKNASSLEYTINNSKYYVNFQWNEQEVNFEFIDSNGNKSNSVFTKRKGNPR
ncbi:MAG: YHYH protein [Candidatus Sericytochromatia bacterium]